MRLFEILFGKRGPVFTERIWFTTERKIADLVNQVRDDQDRGVHSVVVTHFKTTQMAVLEALKKGGGDVHVVTNFAEFPSNAQDMFHQGRSILVLASGALPSSSTLTLGSQNKNVKLVPVSVHLAEHYPRSDRDQQVLALVNIWPMRIEFTCYTGLDEPWLMQCGSSRIVTILHRLALDENVPLQHRWINRFIHNTQKRLAKDIPAELICDSCEDWVRINQSQTNKSVETTSHHTTSTSQTNDGKPPLLSALIDGHLDVADALWSEAAAEGPHMLESAWLGADASGRREFDESLLMNAKSVRWAIEHGADPSAIDYAGWSPLHAITNALFIPKAINAKRDPSETLSVLLEAGSDVQVKWRNGGDLRPIDQMRDSLKDFLSMAGDSTLLQQVQQLGIRKDMTRDDFQNVFVACALVAKKMLSMLEQYEVAPQGASPQKTPEKGEGREPSRDIGGWTVDFSDHARELASARLVHAEDLRYGTAFRLCRKPSPAAPSAIRLVCEVSCHECGAPVNVGMTALKSNVGGGSPQPCKNCKVQVQAYCDWSEDPDSILVAITPVTQTRSALRKMCATVKSIEPETD